MHVDQRSVVDYPFNNCLSDRRDLRVRSLGDKPPSGGFFISEISNLMKTIVYIDGYNLYYGCLRKSEYKWLDLFQLFVDNVLSEDSELLQVKYYTAPVLGRMSDDPKSPQRQRTYLQALRKYRPKLVSIIEGKIIASISIQRNLNPPPDYVKFRRFEEKQSGVSIAVDMACDALTGVCEQVVLCSNDSDLVPVVRKIRHLTPNIRVGLVSPILKGTGRHASSELRRHTHWHKLIKAEYLKSSQLPYRIPNTSITKPAAW